MSRKTWPASAASHRSRRLRSRDAAAARTRPRQLERRRKRRTSLPPTSNCCKRAARSSSATTTWTPCQSHRAARRSAARRQQSPPDRKPNSFSIRRRSTPKPADRSATAACSSMRHTGEQRRRCRRHVSRCSRPHRSQDPYPRSRSTSATNCAPKSPRPSAFPPAQSHRHPPAARRSAPGSRARTSSRPAASSNRPRLRFDFTHYAALDPAEIAEIERLVNQQILRNTPVTTDIMPIDQAIATGAMALFGEKYGDEVRVVSDPRLQQGTLRRHPRHPHRRHRRLQNHFGKQHLRRRSPHRSHHRRRRCSPVPADRATPCTASPECFASPSPNSSNRSSACSPKSATANARSTSSRPNSRNPPRAIWNRKCKKRTA